MRTWAARRFTPEFCSEIQFNRLRFKDSERHKSRRRASSGDSETAVPSTAAAAAAATAATAVPSTPAEPAAKGDSAFSDLGGATTFGHGHEDILSLDPGRSLSSSSTSALFCVPLSSSSLLLDSQLSQIDDTLRAIGKETGIDIDQEPDVALSSSAVGESPSEPAASQEGADVCRHQADDADGAADRATFNRSLGILSALFHRQRTKKDQTTFDKVRHCKTTNKGFRRE
jgi:hypothetical protein